MALPHLSLLLHMPACLPHRANPLERAQVIGLASPVSGHHFPWMYKTSLSPN